MNSTLRSPLVILDREIGHNEPWMLTPYAGYVRLTPALGDASTCGDTGRGDVLLLSDVGYLEGVHEASSVETPSLRPSLEGGCGDVVLLVPSDLMATLSSMSRLARQSAPAIDDLDAWGAHGDWRSVWTHFVDTDSGPTSVLDARQVLSRSGDRYLPTYGCRHYVVGTRPHEGVSVPLVAPRPRVAPPMALALEGPLTPETPLYVGVRDPRSSAVFGGEAWTSGLFVEAYLAAGVTR